MTTLARLTERACFDEWHEYEGNAETVAKMFIEWYCPGIALQLKESTYLDKNRTKVLRQPLGGHLYVELKVA